MAIILVEDNDSIREAVTGYLELEGYDVDGCPTLADASRALERRGDETQAIILDVMLPDGDGFRFAKRLREGGGAGAAAPILFLTARTEESDRITGFELGADDYVVKPFSPKELVLRVKAVLRRGGVAAQDGSQGPKSYRLGEATLRIDEDDHWVGLNDRPLDLTAAEWTILLYLAEYAPRVFDRIHILEACLDSVAEGSERTVDTHIKNLRRKLGNPDWIETVRGFGYRFSGRPA